MAVALGLQGEGEGGREGEREAEKEINLHTCTHVAIISQLYTEFQMFCAVLRIEIHSI